MKNITLDDYDGNDQQATKEDSVSITIYNTHIWVWNKLACWKTYKSRLNLIIVSKLLHVAKRRFSLLNDKQT